jgi:hypothetical protein
MRPEIAGWRPASRGPAAFGGVLDQLLSDLEAVSQPEAVFAGGQEPRAAQVETALAGGPSAGCAGSGRVRARS